MVCLESFYQYGYEFIFHPKYYQKIECCTVFLAFWSEAFVFTQISKKIYTHAPKIQVFGVFSLEKKIVILIEFQTSFAYDALTSSMVKGIFFF